MPRRSGDNIDDEKPGLSRRGLPLFALFPRRMKSWMQANSSKARPESDEGEITAACAGSMTQRETNRRMAGIAKENGAARINRAYADKAVLSICFRLSISK